MHLPKRGRWLATVLLFPLTQCQEIPATAPGLTDDVPAVAIQLHVDVANRTVTQLGLPANSGLSLSVIGTDGVQLQTSNFTQSAPSCKPRPGKIEPRAIPGPS